MGSACKISSHGPSGVCLVHMHCPLDISLGLESLHYRNASREHKDSTRSKKIHRGNQIEEVEGEYCRPGLTVSRRANPWLGLILFARPSFVFIWSASVVELSMTNQINSRRLILKT